MLRTIYGLLDEADLSRIRYVGLTSVRLRRRLSQHVAAARQSGRRAPVNEWIRELLKAGRRPCITPIAAAFGDDVAARLERDVIAQFRGDDLLNVADGGDVPSAEHRRAISAALRGRTVSFATRWRMSRSQRDRHRVSPVVHRTTGIQLKGI